MRIGLPADITWYELLVDNGSLIAGLLALVAGIMAYSIGKKQVTAIRDAMVTTERAFIFCERINAHWIAKKDTEEITAWVFTPIWKNSGNTPTKAAVSCINTWVGIDAGKIPTGFDFPDHDKPGRTMIGPQAVMHGSGLTIPIATMRKMRAGEARAYIWGWFDYSDVFDHTPRHRAEFCMEIVVSGNPIYKEGGFNYRLHGRFNGIDDDCYRRPGARSKVESGTVSGASAGHAQFKR